MVNLTRRLVFRPGLIALLALMAFGAGIAGINDVASASVTPSNYEGTLVPGESVEIEKEVITPAIPPQPDIVFLADTTGSMGGAIANVQANATNVMNTVLASQPTANFAVAEYRDVGDAFVYRVNLDITSNTSDVQSAINGWTAFGGGDFPEAQLPALHGLATGDVTFRPNATKIIAWFGDAPGHDPRAGISETDATNALVAAGIKVIAVNVGGGQLDSTGQATRITNATGGSLQTTASDVAGAILEGLANLPVTVTPVAVGCDPLEISWDSSQQTVVSGSTVSFVETIAVPNDSSLAGQSVNCVVEFQDDNGNVIATQAVSIDIPLSIGLSPATAVNELGDPGQTHSVTATVTSGDVLIAGATVEFEVLSGPNVGAAESVGTDASGEASFTYPGTQGPDGLGTDTIQACVTGADGTVLCEEVTKDWVDTTPPSIGCVETVNPNGNNVPRAGQKSTGQNEDGFYELQATDAVDAAPSIWVSGFGPFSDGDRVKVTEAPGATPSMQTMGSSNGNANAITAHLKLNADAVVTAVDASGNESDPVGCLVAPLPK